AGGWGGGERQGVRVWRGGFAVGVLGAVAARLARDRYRVRRRHKSMLSGQPLSQPPLARQRTSSTTRQLANPAILPHGGLGAFAFNAVPISSRMTGSSIVARTFHGSPSAIFFIVPRRILPERVFGNRATAMATLNAATGPIFSRMSAMHSFSISAGGRLTPDLSTMKPHGTSPLSWSLTPSTAHS